MTSLINDVLSLTRIKGARIMPEYTLFHLQVTAELAIKNYHRLAAEKGVTVINEIPEALKIFADERLILEVFRNLISNAVKFSRKGGRIRVYLPDGKRTTIAVSDTGVGIKSEKIDALFRYEEKTSTKGTSGETGTGLGLPLCLDIVEAHGGHLEIESEVGKGSVFYLRLPDIKPNVLIVDDDESVRKLFIKRLEKLDIVIMETDNGEAALELIKTNRPQLFFVDLHMPGMSGLELLRQIKGDPDTKKIPVIVVTADKTMEVVDHAFMEGADDFIVKPFEKKDLIESVERFIG
jgi:CheY-like chemotaxis protein